MNLPLITDWHFYAAAIPAVLLLGISKSSFGAGFGSLAVPIMALTVTVPQAAAILMPALWARSAYEALLGAVGGGALAYWLG